MTTVRILAAFADHGLFDEVMDDCNEFDPPAVWYYGQAFNHFIDLSAYLAKNYREGGDYLSLRQYENDWHESEKYLAMSTEIFNYAHDNKVKGEYPAFDLKVLEQTRECCRMLGELRGIILKHMQRLEKNGQRSQQRQAG